MDEIRHYSKAGCAYSVATDSVDETTLKHLGYILMSSSYPGMPFVAAEDGTWTIDDTQAFAMLRNERNQRIADTDYMLMSDYPLNDVQRISVCAYRQALRDLPAQEGAPWDGGGEATPWPEIPNVLQDRQGSSTPSVYTPEVM